MPGEATFQKTLLAFIVLAGVLACESTTGVVEVSSVVVTPPSASLLVGETQQFSATPQDASGNALEGRSVTWSTSESSVATVNPTTGLASAVGAGTATITATSEGIMWVGERDGVQSDRYHHRYRFGRGHGALRYLRDSGECHLFLHHHRSRRRLHVHDRGGRQLRGFHRCLGTS